MEKVVRFGVSFEPVLLQKFDELMKRKGYGNRSEAIRDLVREYVAHEQEENVSGVIELVFDPRLKSYKNRIADIENEYHCLISNSAKKYLGHHLCVELLFVRGTKDRLGALLSKLKKSKGVKKIRFDSVSSS